MVMAHFGKQRQKTAFFSCLKSTDNSAEFSTSLYYRPFWVVLPHRLIGHFVCQGLCFEGHFERGLRALTGKVTLRNGRSLMWKVGNGRTP